MKKETALLEAIFYLESEPLDNKTLSKISGLGLEVVEAAIEKLQEKYTDEDSGVELVQISGGWIISPKSEYWQCLKERYGKKNDSRLSRAAMETLSIIAYSQPVTKAEIEAIRGVSADNMIRL